MGQRWLAVVVGRPEMRASASGRSKAALPWEVQGRALRAGRRWRTMGTHAVKGEGPPVGEQRDGEVTGRAERGARALPSASKGGARRRQPGARPRIGEAVGGGGAHRGGGRRRGRALEARRTRLRRRAAVRGVRGIGERESRGWSCSG